MDIPQLVEEKIRKYLDLIYFKRWREKITNVNKVYFAKTKHENHAIYVVYDGMWSPYNYRDLQTKSNYNGKIFTLKKLNYYNNSANIKLPQNY